MSKILHKKYVSLAFGPIFHLSRDNQCYQFLWQTLRMSIHKHIYVFHLYQFFIQNTNTIYSVVCFLLTIYLRDGSISCTHSFDVAWCSVVSPQFLKPFIIDGHNHYIFRLIMKGSLTHATIWMNYKGIMLTKLSHRSTNML